MSSKPCFPEVWFRRGILFGIVKDSLDFPSGRRYIRNVVWLDRRVEGVPCHPIAYERSSRFWLCERFLSRRVRVRSFIRLARASLRSIGSIRFVLPDCGSRTRARPQRRGSEWTASMAVMGMTAMTADCPGLRSSSGTSAVCRDRPIPRGKPSIRRLEALSGSAVSEPRVIPPLARSLRALLLATPALGAA